METMINHKMDISIPLYALEVINTLNLCGYSAYAVGGCVRDSLRGVIPHDWDITTDALPEQIVKCFDGFTVIKTGISHGTVTVISDEKNIEVTTYRIDGAYSDGRHPDTVNFTRSLHGDLSRRDFTVNAMAYSPSDGLTDIFGGCEDIDSGIIRCVGDAAVRFTEDALRIMRALRFSAVLGYAIEPKTEVALNSCANMLKKISVERIYSEFCRLICGKNAAQTIAHYPRVFDIIFGEIKIDAEKIKNLSKLPHDGKYERMAMLFSMSNLSSDEIREKLHMLKADNLTVDIVSRLAADIRRPLTCDLYELKCTLSVTSYEYMRMLMRVTDALGYDVSRQRDIIERCYADNECVKLSQLAINGNDLISAGICGREIGAELNRLLHAVMRGEIANTREKLQGYALFEKKLCKNFN